MSEVQGNTELREFVRVCLRRKGLVLAFTAATVLATLVMTLAMTKIYESRTKVWIEQPSVYTINTSILSGLGAKTTQEGQIELMQSGPYEKLTYALVDVVHYYNAHRTPGTPEIDLGEASDNDRVVAVLDMLLHSPQIHALGVDLPKNPIATEESQALFDAAKKINAKIPQKVLDRESMNAVPVKNADMVEISYQSPDRARARDLANALTAIFIWKNQADRKVEALKTVAFIQEELNGRDGKPGAMKQLEEAEKAVRDFQRQYKIADLDEETKLKIQTLGEIQQMRLTVDSSNKELQAKYSSLTSQLGKEGQTITLPQLMNNPQVQAVQGQLVNAQSDLLALQTQYGDKHPKIEAAKAKIASLQSELAKTAQTIQLKAIGPNPVYQELAKTSAATAAEMLGNRAKLSAVGAAEAQINPELEKLPDLSLKLVRLKRNVAALEKQTSYLLEQLNVARLTERKESGNAQLVEMADDVAKKVRPRNGLNLVLSLIAGLALGAMLASLMEHLDNTLKTAEDVTRVLGAPVLGLIPHMDDVSSPLIMLHDGRSPVSEAYRTLRSNIKFTSLDRPIRTLLVTSPGAGEGKSTTIANTAISMALSGKRIVLIDTDLRRPTIHKVFGLSNEVGLTNILVGEARANEVIQQTDIEGLEVITSGPLPPNPAELLDSARMRDLMETLQLRCDLVLLDSPPVVVVTDAAVLGSTLDGVMLVMESGRVPREVALRAKELLDNGKSRLLGVVLNKMDVERQGGYYYYYSHYYGEGDHRRKKKRISSKR